MLAVQRETPMQPLAETPCFTTVSIDGLPIARLDFRDTLTCLERWLSDPGGRFRRVATANADFLAQSARNAELRTALTSADLVTADGQPLIWLSRLTSTPLPERVAGSDLVGPLWESSARRGHRVFVVGGSDEIVAEIRRRYGAGLAIAGTFTGRVDLDDAVAMERLTRRIQDASADLLLVALGCPKQDLFLSRYGSRTGTKLGIGIGATLEFLTGKKRRAPRVWQFLGLEWLFRALQEPQRLVPRYLHDARYLLRTSLRALVEIRDR